MLGGRRGLGLGLAARAGRQLNGRRQGVTAGLKTGPAVSTFLAR